MPRYDAGPGQSNVGLARDTRSDKGFDNYYNYYAEDPVDDYGSEGDSLGVEPEAEREPFEWNWPVMLLGVLPGLAINLGRAAHHYLSQNPTATPGEAVEAVQAENPQFAEVDTGTLTGTDGEWSQPIQEAVNNSDAPDEAKEGLLSGKRIRKEAQNKLWADMQETSPYESAMEQMGLRGIDTWNTTMDQMQSGEFELPPWMQNISDKNFGRFTEASSRKGQLPGSTAYGQGSAAFNMADQQNAWGFGTDTLERMHGVGTGVWGQLSAAEDNDYNLLFGGGGGVLDPQQQKQPDGPSTLDTLLNIGGDALTTYAGGKAGGLW